MRDKRPGKYYVLINLVFLFNLSVIGQSNTERPLNACLSLDSIKQYTQRTLDSDPGNAQKICIRAIELSELCGDSLAKVRFTTSLGRSYVLSGEYTKGLNYLTESEKLARKIGSKKEEALSIVNQGNVFFFINQYKEALPYYLEALQLSKSLNDSALIAGTYHNIGLCYNKGLNQTDSALFYLLKTLEIAHARKDSSMALFTYSNIGGIFLSIANYSSSLQYFEKAIQDNGKYLSNAVYSYVLVQIGESCYYLKDYKRAEEFLLKGYALAKQSSTIYAVQTATGVLANYYSKQGNYRKAFDYSQENRLISDSLNKKSIIDKLTLLRIEHETDKRNQELKLLTVQKELAETVSNKRSAQRNMALSVVVLLVIIFLLGFRQYRVQKKFNVALQKLVEERTHKLAEALKKAEESDELKTAFLRNISHEVRTPLNAIQGFSSLLLEDQTLDSALREYAATIIKNSGYLTELFENITDITRLEKNDFYFKYDDFKLTKLLGEIIEKFKNRALEKYTGRVEIKLQDAEIDNDLIVRNDYYNLYRLLYLLMDNALKYTPSGQIILKVRYAEPNLLFTVSDTGIGIPVEYHGQIFEKFRKINLYNDKFTRGAGLGLSIARLITEKMGGQIWFESQAGSGSNFYLSIPLCADNFLQPTTV